MAKKIVAFILCLVMVLALGSDALVYAANAAASEDTTTTTTSYRADLYFANKAGADDLLDDPEGDTVIVDDAASVYGSSAMDIYGEAYGASTTINGPGTYTVSVNLYNYQGVLGATATDLGYLYIDITDAYSDFTAKGYYIDDVILTVDGRPVAVNQNHVWPYASAVAGQEDHYIAEIYNISGVSATYNSYAITEEAFLGTDGKCNGNISVTFSVVDPTAPKTYDAYLQFMNADGTIGNWGLCKQEIKEEDMLGKTYTFSWDMYPDTETTKYVAEDIGWLYIEIDDAWADFTGANYDIVDVTLTVDGVEKTLNQDYVWTYASTVPSEEDDFIIELYNVNGKSGKGEGSAFDISNFEFDDNITVSFRIVPKTYKAYLQFVDSTALVGNYPLASAYLPGCWVEIESPDSNVESTKSKTYTIAWNMRDYLKTYYEAYYQDWGYPEGTSSTIKPVGLQHLYIEIDDAFADFTKLGYEVSDVQVYYDGTIVEDTTTEANGDVTSATGGTLIGVSEENKGKVWTYHSVVEGEEDDFIIELYNVQGMSGNGYGSAIDQSYVTGLTFDSNIRVTFTLTDGENKTVEMESDVHTGKWVSEGENKGEFDLTLEGWVSGDVLDVNLPSDVVLVLDQSASMYTPVGLPSYLWHYSLYTGQVTGLERYGVTSADDETADLGSRLELKGILDLLADPTVDSQTKNTFAQKFAQLGYLVAQDRTGDHAYCTTPEHTHTADECSICDIPAHTHTAACGYDESCSNNDAGADRIVSFYTWANDTYPHAKWLAANQTGLHLKLTHITNTSFYRVDAIAEGVSAEATGWEQDDSNYITITNYNASHPATTLQVGDCIVVNDVDTSVIDSVNGVSVSIAPVSAGKSYEIWADASLSSYDNPNTGEVVDTMKDDGERLTDGKYAGGTTWYDNKGYSTWDTNSATEKPYISVIVDLESATAQSDTYTIHGHDHGSIPGPSNVKVYVSDDKSFTADEMVGEASVKWGLEKDVDGRNMFTMQVETGVQTGRYVRFEITGGGMLLFLDEVSVEWKNRVNVLSPENSDNYLSEWGDSQNFNDTVTWDASALTHVNGRLTDGNKSSTDYWGSDYSAFVGDPLISIDLGSRQLTNTYIIYATAGHAGIDVPKFTVTGTNDGVNGVTVAASSEVVRIGEYTYAIIAKADTAVNYQYYYFDIEGQNENQFVFIDEIEVGVATSDTFTVDYLNVHRTTHDHGDDCYLCGDVAHTHALSTCGFDGTTYLCGLGEHEHRLLLTCTDKSAEHPHTDECYACGLPTCGQEAHSHYVDCIGGTDYGCTKTEHAHGNDCFKNCGITAHTHSDSCGLDCGLISHTHSPTNDSDCWTYDWFVVQYDPGTNGTVDVTVNGDGSYTFSADCDDYLDMYRTVYTTSPSKDSNGLSKRPELEGSNLMRVPLQDLKANQFYFYKSQYGALFDSMCTFVNDLHESGVNHRVAVVGFSGEAYTVEYSNGSGIYIDGKYLPLFVEQNQATDPTDPSNATAVENGYLFKHTDSDVWEFGVYSEYYGIDYRAKRDDVYSTIIDGVYARALENVTNQNYDDALVSVKDNYDSVINSVKAVKSDYYYTNHYIGMYMANKVLEQNADEVLDGDMVDMDGDGVNENTRQKMVVLFTDGLAQIQLVEGSAFGGGSWANDGKTGEQKWIEAGYTKEDWVSYQEYTNDQTIGFARTMEETYGAKVYSICTSTVNTTETSGTEYLYYAASDFADDPTTNNRDEGVDSVEEGNSNDEYDLEDASFIARLNYFMRVQNASEMLNAFNKVFSDIGGTTSNLSVNASMQDILSMEFELKLSDALMALISANGSSITNATYPEITEYIKVYTVDACEGPNESNFPDNTTGLSFLSTAEGVNVFGDTEDEKLVLEIGKRADGRYYVRVDGFDYAGNFVSKNGRDTDSNGEEDFWGRKLVLVIPMQTRDGNDGGKYVETNYDRGVIGSHSGIISYNYDLYGEMVDITLEGEFEDPHVDLPTTVTVEKTVLNGVGEELPDNTDPFTFAGNYTQFAEYSVYDTDGAGHEEVIEGLTLGGNYLMAVEAAGTLSDTQINAQQSIPIADVLVGTGLTVTETQGACYKLVDLKVSYVDRTTGLTVTGSYLEKTLPTGITVNLETGEVTVTEVLPSMVLEFVNQQTVGDLAIKKEGAQNIDANQTFIFHIQGADANTSGINMTVVIKGNNTITIKDLPVGAYIITEDSGWSWRYEIAMATDVTTSNEAGATAKNGGYQIALDAALVTVTFKNTREEDKWMDGNSHNQNLFTGKKEETAV